jgi:peptidyl-prolyl cis-trans isomerase C
MKFNVSLTALCVSLLTCLAGCKRDQGDTLNFRHNKDGKGTPVASFNGDSITVEELKQRFSEMSPFLRSRYATVEQRKDYVDGLARFELLAQEAHRRGLQNDPEVIETAKKVMVQKLIQKEFDEKQGAVAEQEVKDYYEAHKNDYVKPELVRITDIFFAAPKEDAAARKKKKAKAEEVLTKAKAINPADTTAFVALVRENSEDAKTKPMDGDSRFLSEADLTSQFGKEVATAAVNMKRAGELSNVIETPTGFYLIRFQSRQAALNLGMDQVKAQIENRIKHERRTQNFNKFVDTLKSKNGYKLNEEALSKVEVDLKAPSSERKGPEPGFMPSPVAGGRPTARPVVPMPPPVPAGKPVGN